MNIFRRKKEEKRISKPLVIVIEISIAVLLFLAAIGIKWLLANKYNPKILKFEDQIVEGITFSDFKLDYREDKNNLQVNAINYTEEEKNIKKIMLKLYSKDNTLISQIEVENDIKLKSNEKYLISATVDTEVKIGKVEYEIGK